MKKNRGKTSAHLLTKEHSFDLNRRIRELREQGVAGPDLPRILNREFGIELTLGAYKRRVASLGLAWGGARATGAESNQINERLAELCAERIPGADIADILNREFRRNFTPSAYYHRAEEQGLTIVRRHPGPSANRQSVPQGQRNACLQDPAWEARNEIADRTACRECFRFYRAPLVAGHLQKQHRMDLNTYRKAHPGARVFSFEYVARDTGQECKKVMAEFAASYATPDERAEAARDPNYYKANGITKYRICCVDRCGLKATDLAHHLRNVHGMSSRDYWIKCGQLPISTEVVLANLRTKAAAKRTELERLRQLAKRGPRVDTADRIWLSAYWLTLGWSLERIARKLYPTLTREDAKNNYKNAVTRKYGSQIEGLKQQILTFSLREQERLASLAMKRLNLHGQ